MIAALLVAAALQVASTPATRQAASSRARATQPVTRKPTPKAAPTAAPTSRNVAKVVIDAGHGGVDPGAPILVGNSTLREKDITLQIAIKLGNALRQRGIDVIYTRSTDTLIALVDRGRMANQNGGDVFISIHVNAANKHWKNPGAARGFETYFLAEAKTEDARRVESMENEATRFEASAPLAANDPLSFILRDMEQNQYLRESSDFAGIVQRRLGQVHPGPNRGVKQAGFHVLVSALMPAILIETGFGTNASEASYLASSVRQVALARVIADATAEYLSRYQRRVGSSGGLLGTHE